MPLNKETTPTPCILKKINISFIVYSYFDQYNFSLANFWTHIAITKVCNIIKDSN